MNVKGLQLHDFKPNVDPSFMFMEAAVCGVPKKNLMRGFKIPERNTRKEMVNEMEPFFVNSNKEINKST